ncbi:PQQ-like beta-propeller repeat protein [Candidatus Roizmanbacteria bacterium]|nr:PQQ-like beta-propeller repeat protein [Candidatus Roizmanbacteria bacterium]
MKRIIFSAASILFVSGFLLLFLTSSFPTSQPSVASAQTSVLHWPMAGHDVERTSRADEAPHTVAKNPRWFKRIHDFRPGEGHYIPAEAHLVTYPGEGSRPGLIFVPTSGGLYALKEDGSLFWFYKTDMPVGHSPTIVNDVAYVSVFDKTIHAVNIDNGQKIWQTDTAGAGFDTSPIVVNNTVYAGNRDGYFYAFDAGDNGAMKWSFKTGGRISYSAAYKNNVLYFASNDSHAYAVNATTGQQIWKSAKLPGDGFYSYWPVIITDKVIFPGTSPYRNLIDIYFINDQVLPANDKPMGVDPDSNGWYDAALVQIYLAANPQRRNVFVLNQSNGQEVTPYAPILHKGANSALRYPPVVTSNNTLIFNAPHTNVGDLWLKGNAMAWKLGTSLVKPAGGGDSNDEIDAHAVIGSYLYSIHHSDQGGGVYNISNLESQTTPFSNQITELLAYKLREYFPNYYEGWDKRKYGAGPKTLGTGNFGYANPPVPLGNNVYFHRSNAIVSFGP